MDTVLAHTWARGLQAVLRRCVYHHYQIHRNKVTIPQILNLEQSEAWADRRKPACILMEFVFWQQGKIFQRDGWHKSKCESARQKNGTQGQETVLVVLFQKIKTSRTHVMGRNTIYYEVFPCNWKVTSLVALFNGLFCWGSKPTGLLQSLASFFSVHRVPPM